MDIASEIVASVQAVTKKWAKQRKAEERRTSAGCRRRDAMVSRRRETVKDVAWEVMESAYMRASSGSTLPAHARQIMYAARGEIQERAGGALNDQYFTQTLLPDYLREHREGTSDWDVVFDARGHLAEPHTGVRIPLGTLDVRAYLHSVAEHEDLDETLPGCAAAYQYPTAGPEHRFAAVLFIEKEGFLPLFQATGLAERYDVAVMSTKGMSSTAARLLVDNLCEVGAEVPLLVVRDFDKAGFSIVGTLQRDTRRYEFQNHVTVVDLGLRLDDVRRYELESENVSYGKSDPRRNLEENGATDEEIAFLCGDGRPGHYRGRRVELNAFSSGDLIQWIEKKLEECGVRKVVPDDATLEVAYRRALRRELQEQTLRRLDSDITRQVEETVVPEGLAREVEERLHRDRELPWDRVVGEMVARHVEAEEEGNG